MASFEASDESFKSAIAAVKAESVAPVELFEYEWTKVADSQERLGTENDVILSILIESCVSLVLFLRSLSDKFRADLDDSLIIASTAAFSGT